MPNPTSVHVVDLEPLVVSRANAARLLGISGRKLQDLTAPHGPIRSVRLGRTHAYAVDDLRAFLRDPENYAAEAGGASQ